MQFSCGQCSTRYSVPDEKVRGKRIRTKCRKCGAEIVVDGPTGDGSAPPSGASPPSSEILARPSERPRTVEAAPRAQAAPARTEEKWTVALDRTTQRKMTLAEFADAFARGEVTDSTLIWKPGMAGWQPPEQIPAIALALRARGIEPRKDEPQAEQVRTPPPPAAASPAPEAKNPAKSPPASDGGVAALASWDDENEATRVVDGALPFPGLAAKRAAPAPRSLPVPKPAPAPRPVPAPKPAPPVPARAAPPKPPPSTPSTAGFDEDETTRVVGAGEARDLLAPVIATKAARIAPVPVKAVGAAPTPKPPPSVPSSPKDLGFDDEATAVIAPDRARELLLAEAAKGEAPEAAKGPGPAGAPRPAPAVAEPPKPAVPAPAKDLGFDDEATQVVAPERAEQLLASSSANRAITERPPPGPPAEFPPPGTPTGAASAAVLDARRSKPGTVESGPTIVLAQSKPPEKPEPEADKAKEPGVAATKAAVHRELAGLAHEKTRVVQRVTKKSTGVWFWVMVAFALTAAATGGFVASRLFEGKKLPTWHRP